MQVAGNLCCPRTHDRDLGRIEAAEAAAKGLALPSVPPSRRHLANVHKRYIVMASAGGSDGDMNIGIARVIARPGSPGSIDRLLDRLISGYINKAAAHE
jgi:hypothetical protein